MLRGTSIVIFIPATANVRSARRRPILKRRAAFSETPPEAFAGPDALPDADAGAAAATATAPGLGLSGKPPAGSPGRGSCWSTSGLAMIESWPLHVSPSSGLIGQLGSDMTRMSPHTPATVNGRRMSP